MARLGDAGGSVLTSCRESIELVGGVGGIELSGGVVSLRWSGRGYGIKATTRLSGAERSRR